MRRLPDVLEAAPRQRDVGVKDAIALRTLAAA